MFYLHPDPWGNDSQVDEHIFQLGWFNHRLEQHLLLTFYDKKQKHPSKFYKEPLRCSI